ncbi:unnamed protein product [Urochloa humidicola]
MSEVDDEAKQVSYGVVKDKNGNVKLNCPAIATASQLAHARPARLRLPPARAHRRPTRPSARTRRSAATCTPARGGKQ